MKRLSQNEIERELSIMQTPEELAVAAKSIAAFAEATKPKRQVINEKPWDSERWNGVKGGPAGRKVQQ